MKTLLTLDAASFERSMADQHWDNCMMYGIFIATVIFYFTYHDDRLRAPKLS